MVTTYLARVVKLSLFHETNAQSCRSIGTRVCPGQRRGGPLESTFSNGPEIKNQIIIIFVNKISTDVIRYVELCNCAN